MSDAPRKISRYVPPPKGKLREWWDEKWKVCQEGPFYRRWLFYPGVAGLLFPFAWALYIVAKLFSQIITPHVQGHLMALGSLAIGILCLFVALGIWPSTSPKAPAPPPAEPPPL